MPTTLFTKILKIADNSAKHFNLELVSLEKNKLQRGSDTTLLITSADSALSIAKLKIENRLGVSSLHPFSWTIQFNSNDAYIEFRDWCDESEIYTYEFDDIYDGAKANLEDLEELDQFESGLRFAFQYFAEEYCQWVAPEVLPQNTHDKIIKLLTGIAQENNYQLVLNSDYFYKNHIYIPLVRKITLWLQPPDDLEIYLSIDLEYKYGETKQDLKHLMSIELREYYVDLLGQTLVSDIKQFNREFNNLSSKDLMLEKFIELYKKIIDYCSIPN